MQGWDFLHRWYMPFLWLALSSAISVPVAVYFQLGMETHTGSELGLAYGSSWVLRDDFMATIVVYVLNLGAAIWFFDADGSTRWAAFWATLAAFGRVVAPVTLATMSDVAFLGTHYVDWQTLRILIWSMDLEMFFFGIMLWGVFARFVGETGGAAAHAMRPAEA